MNKGNFSTYDMMQNKDQVVPLERLPGIYRAIVKDNADDQKRARVKVLIPAVHNPKEKKESLPWADCCSVIAGPDRALIRIPDINDVVYVFFEQGDREFPVWMGSWWGKSDLPDEIPKGKESKHLLIKVGEGLMIDISEELGNKYLSIKSSNGSEVTLNDTDSEINIKGGSVTTKINIVPGASSEVTIGNQPFTPCNDFPQCLFTGAPHYIGTNLPGNTIKIP